MSLQSGFLFAVGAVDSTAFFDDHVALVAMAKL